MLIRESAEQMPTLIQTGGREGLVGCWGGGEGCWGGGKRRSDEGLVGLTGDGGEEDG